MSESVADRDGRSAPAGPHSSVGVALTPTIQPLETPIRAAHDFVKTISAYSASPTKAELSKGDDESGGAECHHICHGNGWIIRHTLSTAHLALL